MTKMFVDPKSHGIIRWDDDPTAGILAGMRAKEIVTAVNSYDALREALTAVRAEVNLSKAPKLMAKIEAALGLVG